MELTGVPRATVPRRHAHRRARALLACSAAGPLLGLVALTAALGRPSTAAGAGSDAGRDRAFAQVAAADVLAGRPTTLPCAAGIDPYLGRDIEGAPPAPIAYRSLAWGSARPVTGVTGRAEIDTFLVATSGGLWHLDIEVLDGPDGPVIGADPSLSPAPTAPEGSAGAVAGGADQVSLGQGAVRQLQAWAAAYVGGDPAALYRLTGDTRDDVYATLVGWALDVAQVTGAWSRPGGAVAEVAVTMHLVNQPDDHLTSVYDVLLSDLDQPLPWVRAWGPPGAGATLTPLADAIPERA